MSPEQLMSQLISHCDAGLFEQLNEIKREAINYIERHCEFKREFREFHLLCRFTKGNYTEVLLNALNCIDD